MICVAPASTTGGTEPPFCLQALFVSIGEDVDRHTRPVQAHDRNLLFFSLWGWSHSRVSVTSGACIRKNMYLFEKSATRPKNFQALPLTRNKLRSGRNLTLFFGFGRRLLLTDVSIGIEYIRPM